MASHLDEANTTRDYAADMRAVIDAETADEPYVPRAVADHIVAKLRITDPDLLDGWLHAQAVTLLAQAIDARDRSRRGYIRQTARRGVFAEAANQHAGGAPEALHQFLAMPLTVASGHRKRLADLSADDLRHVAEVYAQRAQDNLLMASFLRVLAKKVRTGTVADHFDEEKLVTLWQSQVDRAGG